MSSLVQSVDWLAIAPPTIAAVVGLVVLVADLFVGEKNKPLLGWVSLAGLAAATLMLLPLLDGDRAEGEQAAEAGGLAVEGGAGLEVVQRGGAAR